jgi:hypothetical protein
MLAALCTGVDIAAWLGRGNLVRVSRSVERNSVLDCNQVGKENRNCVLPLEQSVGNIGSRPARRSIAA